MMKTRCTSYISVYSHAECVEGRVSPGHTGGLTVKLLKDEGSLEAG